MICVTYFSIIAEKRRQNIEPVSAGIAQLLLLKPLALAARNPPRKALAGVDASPARQVWLYIRLVLKNGCVHQPNGGSG
ncbi:hypothetical protein D3C86_1951540 [compost metagenome]